MLFIYSWLLVLFSEIGYMYYIDLSCIISQEKPRAQVKFAHYKKSLVSHLSHIVFLNYISYWCIAIMTSWTSMELSLSPALYTFTRMLFLIPRCLVSSCFMFTLALTFLHCYSSINVTHIHICYSVHIIQLYGMFKDMLPKFQISTLLTSTQENSPYRNAIMPRHGCYE